MPYTSATKLLLDSGEFEEVQEARQFGAFLNHYRKFPQPPECVVMARYGWYAGAGKVNIVIMQDWLHLIEGGRRSREPRAGRRRSLNQSEQVTCWKCENERGIATSRFRKAVLCPRRDPDGKIRGGTQVWVCDYCGTKIAPVK